MGLLANIKVTMEFIQGITGWSESHFYSGVDIALNDPALIADATALAYARAGCLGGDVIIDLVKMSQDNLNRDVAYLKPAAIPQTNPPGNPSSNLGYSNGPTYPDGASSLWSFQSPHLSWPLKLTDNNNNQIAIVYLAGMPASKKQFGPGPLQSTGQTAAYYLNNYGTYLATGNKWGALSRAWPAGVFDLASSTPGDALPTYLPAAGPAPARLVFSFPLAGPTADLETYDWIRVGGVNYTTPQTRLRLNGSYQIIGFGPGTVIVAAPRVLTAPTFTSFGYYQGADYKFAPYQGYTLDNLTHRKRGRVISAPRGRR